MTRRLRADDQASLDRIAAALEKLCAVSAEPLQCGRNARCYVDISIDAMRHSPAWVLKRFAQGPLAERLSERLLELKEQKRQR